MVKSLIHTDYNPTKLEDTVNITIDHFILAPNNYKSEFNWLGYLIRITEYEYLWKEDTLKPKGIWKFYYDEQNRVTEELYFWNDQYQDTTRWTYQYFGDTSTLVIKNHRVISSVKSKNYYRYTQRGNKEFLTTSNSDSSYITRNLFAYDKIGRLIRKEEYEDEEYLTFIRSWQYSDTLATNPSVDVGISAKYNYGPIITFNEYDSLGNLIISRAKEQSSSKHTEYRYDETSNWITRKTYLPNGLVKISKRKIEYFEE